MRPLAQGVYSQAQVEAQLFDPNVTIGTIFDVLDRDGGLITALPLGDAGVQVAGASIEMNVDATIRSTFRCRMRSIEALRGVPFTKLIRPSFVVRMPDGGSVQFPLGHFVWSSPNRDVWPNDEWWDVGLGDKGHLLELGGPGKTGFQVAANSLFSTGLNRVFQQAGFPESCPTLDVRFKKTLFWGLTTPKTITTWRSQYSEFLSKSTPQKGKVRTPAQRKAQTQAHNLAVKLSKYVVENAPTTWLSIIYGMCNAVGFTFWFDGDGNPRVVPARDLTNATPDFTFQCSETGQVMSRVSTSTDYDSIANRVFVRLKDDASLPVVVDANTVMPWHPLAEAKIGVYIDTTIDQNTDVGAAPASAQGKAKLFKSMGAYELVRFDALVHPGLEPFDILGLRVPDDPEFEDRIVLHHRQHGIDLAAGTMTVEGSRVFTP